MSARASHDEQISPIVSKEAMGHFLRLDLFSRRCSCRNLYRTKQNPPPPLIRMVGLFTFWEATLYDPDKPQRAFPIRLSPNLELRKDVNLSPKHSTSDLSRTERALAPLCLSPAHEG